MAKPDRNNKNGNVEKFNGNNHRNGGNCNTAAGDIYHGAFTYFIGNGHDLYNSIRLANIAGALSVKCLGGKNSMPDLDKVLEIGEELVI